ncbi:MAG TPA: MauE/DoxX family redox-associated membrane protein [Armatimonadota bacterium]|jgi:uncharacterized membrane protein YphA (DoxX/SURF4 family)
MTRTGRWSLAWWLNLALRLVIAAVFLYAAVDKIAHPDRFADIVSDYQLLPAFLVNPFAVIMPWVEVALGVWLVVGAWTPSAALLASGMTVMFMAAIVAALAIGAGDLHCGCFTTSQEGRSEAWGLLVRDAFLLAATVWLLVRSYRAEARTAMAAPEGEADAEGE